MSTPPPASTQPSASRSHPYSPPPAQPWSASNLDNPHALADKATRFERMFAAIAPSYDLNNRVHSLWRDQAWRRAAVRMAQVQPGDRVLDVACGTGDLTLAFARAGAAEALGVDFTEPMLDIARQKAADSSRDGRHADLVSFRHADAMALPFDDATFDVVSIAFGIRNVADPAKAMAEFHRVLRPGGRLIVLEFETPRVPPMSWLYRFYFEQVMTRTATLISGDRSGAYRYLPRSVQTFLTRAQMCELMTRTGFTNIRSKALTLGIAVVYRGERV